MKKFRAFILIWAILAVALVFPGCDDKAGGEIASEARGAEESRAVDDSRDGDDDGLASAIDIADEPYYPVDLLDEEALRQRSLRELSLMRNTIFARAGFEFSSPWLREHFESRGWYEGGPFQEERLSEVDRRNVATLRHVEESFSREELQERWLSLWQREGGVALDYWEPPGPWEGRDEQIEAALLARALNLPRASQEDGDSTGQGPSQDRAPLSATLAGATLGQRPPAEAADNTQVEVFGIRGRLRLVTDDDGLITHIIIFAQTMPTEGDLIDIYSTDQVAGAIREVFGEPTTAPASTWAVLEPYIWMGEGYRLEVQFHDLCCGDHEIRLVLRTEDPKRICGPDDGFHQWALALSQEIQGGDAQAAAARFRFPFRDIQRLVFDNPGEEPFDFEDADAFVERFSEVAETNFQIDEHSFSIGDTFRCDPIEGYIWFLYPLGPLTISRVNRQWRATSITYTP